RSGSTARACSSRSKIQVQVLIRWSPAGFLILSLRQSPTGWASGCQSADRLWRPMVDVSGLRHAYRRECAFSSRYRLQVKPRTECEVTGLCSALAYEETSALGT